MSKALLGPFYWMEKSNFSPLLIPTHLLTKTRYFILESKLIISSKKTQNSVIGWNAITYLLVWVLNRLIKKIDIFNFIKLLKG